MENKLEIYSNDEIIEILNDSKSFREALNKFNYCSNGSAGYVSAKRILKKRNITIPLYHYHGNGKSNPKYGLNEILVENSKYTSRKRLKIRLINEGLLEYKCKCGNIGTWQGKTLVLQLEHKNGINNDNRLKNLEFLCPNCHSQSEIFAGKNNNNSNKKIKTVKYCECGTEIYKTSIMCKNCRNKFIAQKNRKVKSRPTYEELIVLVNNNGYRGTGIIYGVSDNTIRNWLKLYTKTRNKTMPKSVMKR